MQKLPISEVEISKAAHAPVYSPILCASLDDLNIDSKTFIDQFKGCFRHMSWDLYDVKRKQLEILIEHQVQFDQNHFRNYYDQTISFTEFSKAKQLSKDVHMQCESIKPWRRRAVCSYRLSLSDESVEIEREYPEAFTQNVMTDDIRSWPRTFGQTDSAVVDNELFYTFLKRIAHYAQKVTPHIRITDMSMTAHFMSVKAKEGLPGNNSPEGAHEDGADFIVSALVINRQNITGGESQVLEKLDDGSMVNLFNRELQPGEFLFQADTGEEKHYGNDLWHYVTPFYVQKPGEESWRDIIGLDIVIHPAKT